MHSSDEGLCGHVYTHKCLQLVLTQLCVYVKSTYWHLLLGKMNQFYPMIDMPLSGLVKKEKKIKAFPSIDRYVCHIAYFQLCTYLCLIIFKFVSVFMFAFIILDIIFIFCSHRKKQFQRRQHQKMYFCCMALLERERPQRWWKLSCKK